VNLPPFDGPPPSGFSLTAAEASHLATYLAARHLADLDWIEWEDVPELTEASWLLLLRHLRLVVDEVMREANDNDRCLRIDSRYLFERATEPAPAGVPVGEPGAAE
jgi:hypothetical protein